MNSMLQDYQQTCVKLRQSLNNAAPELASKIEQVLRESRETYRNLYLRDLQSEYPANWKEEIVRRKDKARAETRIAYTPEVHEEYWALRYLYSKYVTLYRKTQRKSPVHADWAWDQQQYIDWQTSDDADESPIAFRASCIQRAMMGLTDRQRQVVELCMINKLSQVEAAQVMGVAKSTVSRTLTRAKQNIESMCDYAIRHPQSDDPMAIHLSSPEIWKRVTAALNPYHLLIIHLYYTCGLSVYKIGTFVDRKPCTITRNLYKLAATLRVFTHTDRVRLYEAEKLDQFVIDYWTPRILDGSWADHVSEFNYANQLHKCRMPAVNRKGLYTLDGYPLICMRHSSGIEVDYSLRTLVLTTHPVR